MKIAIIGSGPQSLEVGSLLHDMGAALTFFTSGQDDLSLISLVYPHLGDGVVATYRELREELHQHHVVKAEKVKRVQKRFLLPEEWAGERRRLHDLFRIVFESVPKEKIEQQIKENPAFYSELPAEVVEGLHHNIESYDDFDVVIDARERWKSKAMGVGGFALSEELHLHHPQLAYGPNVFKQINQTISGTELALVGSGELALESLERLRSWLFSAESHRIFLVTTEENPFERCTAEDARLATLWEKLAMEIDQHFELKAGEFMTEMNRWKELDDFVKVKVKRPEEPVPKLVIFAGHNVMSVDSLLDRQRIFLTLEIPPFRRAMVQDDNAQLAMKTIGVDHVFVLTGTHRDTKILKGIDLNEPGLFTFNHRAEIFTEEGRYFFQKECQDLIQFLTQLFTRNE